MIAAIRRWLWPPPPMTMMDQWHALLGTSPQPPRRPAVHVQARGRPYDEVQVAAVLLTCGCGRQAYVTHPRGEWRCAQCR
jgi:hypothetical protein